MSAITVEVTTEIRVRVTLDVVEFFAKLSEREQKDYAGIDIHELGMEAEWERPLAYLWPTEDRVEASAFAYRGREWIDFDDGDIRVRSRGEHSFYGKDTRWTEDDFAALCAAVPWLAAVHVVDGLSPEDAARVPGPNDPPMFEVTS